MQFASKQPFVTAAAAATTAAAAFVGCGGISTDCLSVRECPVFPNAPQPHGTRTRSVPSLACCMRHQTLRGKAKRKRRAVRARVISPFSSAQIGSKHLYESMLANVCDFLRFKLDQLGVAV